MENEQYQYDDSIRQNTIRDYINARREQYNFQRWLLDDVEEINYLQNALRGIMYNRMTDTYDLIPETRLMNDKGARILTETYLLPIIKNAKLSNFTETEIRLIMLKAMKSIIRHLYVNMNTYEIRFENADLIVNLIDTYLKSVLNRALGGAEQDRLVTTQKVVSEERIMPVQDQQQQHNDNRGGSRGVKGWNPF